jgi:hypothetical protein
MLACISPSDKLARFDIADRSAQHSMVVKFQCMGMHAVVVREAEWMNSSMVLGWMKGGSEQIEARWMEVIYILKQR